MQKSWIRSLSVALAVGLLSMATTGLAQSSLEYFESARSLAHKGNYTRAASMFAEVAHADADLPEAAWNVAFLSAKTADYENCALYYRFFLYSVPKPSDLKETQSALASCEHRILQSGKLDIFTTHQDATISIDDIPIAKERAQGVVLRAGKHKVSISAPGYDTITQSVAIAADVTTHISETLKETISHGTLILNIDRPDATIRLDGKKIGTSPLPEKGIEARANKEMLLTIEKDGFLTWQRYINVSADLEYEADVHLMRDHSQE